MSKQKLASVKVGDSVIINTGNADRTIPSVEVPGTVTEVIKSKSQATVSTDDGVLKVHLQRLRKA